jgi:thioredoxin reductase/ferredoxin
MNIPKMNRLIAERKFSEALTLVHEEIALPLILGTICPAPCEKACRRKPIDGAVSVCLLKQFTAHDPARLHSDAMQGIKKNGKKVAVIGTGPAGLSAAFHLLRRGHGCVLFDKEALAGGSLRYRIPEDKLPREFIDAEVEHIRSMGAGFRLDTPVGKEYFEEVLLREFDAVILATGNRESNPVSGFTLEPIDSGILIDRKTMVTSRPGVFGCGSVVREESMAVRSAAQGKTAAMEADIYLKTHKPGRIHYQFHSAFGPLFSHEQDEYLKESIVAGRYPPVNGNLIGFTEEEAVREAKRCLHCDCRKPDTCKLRQVSDTCKANRKRYLGATRKSLTRNIRHELVVYEPEKCIKCGLCVEITKREGEPLGLTSIGRGFDFHIAVPFRDPLNAALVRTVRACVEACPTGALALKTEN